MYRVEMETSGGRYSNDFETIDEVHKFLVEYENEDVIDIMLEWAEDATSGSIWDGGYYRVLVP